MPDPLTQVARPEAMAALLGMRPAPLADARVLELGCGTGANLLPLALAYPGATIVGCDLADLQRLRKRRGGRTEFRTTSSFAMPTLPRSMAAGASSTTSSATCFPGSCRAFEQKILEIQATRAGLVVEIYGAWAMLRDSGIVGLLTGH